MFIWLGLLVFNYRINYFHSYDLTGTFDITKLKAFESLIHERRMWVALFDVILLSIYFFSHCHKLKVPKAISSTQLKLKTIFQCMQRRIQNAVNILDSDFSKSSILDEWLGSECAFKVEKFTNISILRFNIFSWTYPSQASLN